MLTLDSPEFAELRRDFNEWLPAIAAGRDKYITVPLSMRELVVELDHHAVHRVLVEIARRCVCKVSDLKGPRRNAAIARPRMLAYLVLSETIPSLTLMEVARIFGRDHATVLHGIARAREIIADSKDWLALYEEILEAL